jgi:dihydroflavonol-4-reductase
MDSSLPTERLICVTGASGFVGSQIVRELLEHGYRVRGTGRSPARAIEEGHLTSLPGADRLQLVAADLNQPGSFDEAVRGCDYVIHTASPYVVTVDDPQRDLVDPAVNGTRSVLESVRKAGDAKRVVVTSSMAAVTDEPEGTFSEKDWNETSSLTRNPYYYSKVMGERVAWEFAATNPGFDIVVVNPSIVIGPSLVPSVNTSSQILVGLTDGTYQGILDLNYPLVDVRDVATAHRLAMENPSASGRYVCAAEVWSMRRVVGFVRDSDLAIRKLPSIGLDNAFGTALVKLAAAFQSSGTRGYLRTNLGRKMTYDTSKIRSELGMSFRPVEQSLLETYRDLRRWGHVT